MDTATESRMLEELIAQQGALLAELKMILEREHRALSDQNADEINAVTVGKRELARSLDIIERKRMAIADTPSLEANPSWQHVLELARECEQLNQVNGLIVTGIEGMDEKYAAKIQELEERIKELELKQGIKK